MAACPILTLYHGTNGDNAASILNAGLQASTDGRLGTGVYFTDSKAVATSIAAYKGLAFVVTCEVQPRTTIDCDKTKNYKGWHGAYDCATAQHPPWAGATHHFTEYCVPKKTRIRVVHVEGFVSRPTVDIFPSAAYYVINKGHSKFLDTNGKSVQVWGNSRNNDYGPSPKNIRWRFDPVDGTLDTFYIVNEGHLKFLDNDFDRQGGPVTVWGDGRDVGQIPANIQWQLRPVDGKAGIYYIVNVGHKMFLDTHGGSVWVWGDGVDVGHVPQNIQWALKIVTG